MPLTEEEVLAIALMGLSPISDPMNVATFGYSLDPSLYIPVSPPPPPPPYVGGGGGYTGAANIAATPGNWIKVRPLWDALDQQTFRSTSKGVIVVHGRTSVVVVPRTEKTLELPWDQLRIEDEMLLGVIGTEHAQELRSTLETVDDMILKQDDMLLLLGGIVDKKDVDDEDVILFI